MEKQRKRRTRTLALLLALGLIFSGTATSPAASVGDSQAEEQNEAEMVDTADETAGADDPEDVSTVAEENSVDEATAGNTDSEQPENGDTEETVVSVDETETIETECLEPDGISSDEIGVPQPCNPYPFEEPLYQWKIIKNSGSKETLSWTKIEGADSYVVYRKGDKETEWTKTGVKCYVTDPDYTPGDEIDDYHEDEEQVFCQVNVPIGDWYTYVCCAVIDGVEGGFNPDSYRVVSLPAVSTGKSSMYNCSVGVKLEWKAIDGAEGYKLYRREFDTYENEAITSWKGIAWIRDGSRSSWLDKTAEHGHEYQYAIRAYYTLEGKTTHAALVNFQTAYGWNDLPLVYVQRLSNVSVEAAGNNTVRVTWAYPADPTFDSNLWAQGPEITYCSDPDFQGKIYKINVNVTFDSDFRSTNKQSAFPVTAIVNLPSAGTYYFRVRNRYRSFDNCDGTYVFKSGRSDTLKVTVN